MPLAPFSDCPIVHVYTKFQLSGFHSSQENFSLMTNTCKYINVVNRLIGLSLPRKSVARLTDRPNMTLAIDRGR